MGTKVDMKIPINECPIVQCSCGCDKFVQLFNVRIIPRIYSPDPGRVGNLNVGVGFACLDCGLEVNILETIKRYEESEDKKSKVIVLDGGKE
jgi:hypothetical protein